MSLKINLEEQELIADTLRRGDDRLPARDRWVETALGLGFVLAAIGMFLSDPPRAFAPVPGILCLLVLVLATRVRFVTPFGFTVATQLAFVPLLFALPVTLVPFAVVVAMATARLPELLDGSFAPSGLIKEIVNSWYVIGPVAVFVLSRVTPDQAGAGILIIALLIQFAVDFSVSSVRYWFERGATLSTQLRDTWIYGIDAALSVIALVVAEDVHRTTSLVVLAPLPLLALLATFARERHERIQGLIELNAAYHGTALVLGDVVEADDGYTGEHCKSVVQLALALADQLGLAAEQRRNLEFGALLHDVGKIAIPKEIINKPGKLDPGEWKIITTHTLEGQKMLDRIGGFMRDVGLIVRSHHERWDGDGYPDGLSGEAIPIEARIISCCDSWNAMRTNRSYRQALSHEVARTELQANAGGQFDPDIVRAFLTMTDTLHGSHPAEPVDLQPASPLLSHDQTKTGRLTRT